MSVVAETAALTPAWFGEVLGTPVRGVELEPMHIGAMCTMVRARLDAADGPASVVVKLPTSDAGTRALADAMRMYELEVRFYGDLRPLLDDVGVPACHLAELDAGGGFTLVLEDLEGARAGDVLTESDPDECATVLAELARLQAATWDHPALAQMPWLADPAPTVALFDSMAGGLQPFLDRFGHALAPEHVALFEAVVPRAGDWVRSWAGPRVVQHGDLRSDNVLFRDGRATLVDFQTVRLGPAGVDPAYYLGSSLQTATRRALERDLLAEHHERLAAGGVEVDAGALWAAYREGALYAVLLFVGLSAQVAPSERVDRVIADQSRRYADMALDLESAELAGLR